MSEKIFKRLSLGETEDTAYPGNLGAKNTNDIAQMSADIKDMGIVLDELCADVPKALDSKADKGTTLAQYGIKDAYTKTEVNELVSTLEDGTPTDVITPILKGGTGASTAEDARENLGVMSSEYVNSNFTKTDLSNVSDQALKSKIESIGIEAPNGDYSDIKELLAQQQASLDNKVDKVSGKGLSSNDYTTEEKNKLNSIETAAQVNTVTGVKGENETDYRIGNINITAENIGASKADLSNVDNTIFKAKANEAGVVSQNVTASGTPIVQFTAHPNEAASGPIYYGTSNEIEQIYNGLEILACFDGSSSTCGMLYLNSTETCHGSGYVKSDNPTSMVMPLLNITANRVMKLRYRSDVADNVFSQAGGCWVCMDPVYDYNSSGVLPIEYGGTGANSVSLARYNLGIYSITNIYSGSYTGTGTYGSSNLNKLSFGSAPKLVVISSGSVTLIMIRGCTNYSIEYGNNWFSGNITWSDNSVSWFGNDASSQFNSSGETYNYVAFG